MSTYMVNSDFSQTRFSKLFPNGLLRNMIGFESFTFPSKGTILSTNANGRYLVYEGCAVCDVGSNMCKELFVEV